MSFDHGSHSLRRVRLGWRLAASGIAALTWLATPSMAQGQEWPGTHAARMAAELRLNDLRAELLTHDSATLVLDRWCARHRIARGAKIVAERVRDGNKEAPADIRAALQVSATEAIAYRHVRLTCGGRTLSDADNWYVPGRLPKEINQALESSDIPFGRAVMALRFKRTTLASNRLWFPMPAGWDNLPPTAWPAEAQLKIPEFLLENRGLLVLAGDRPISAVIERYTRAVMASPPPVALNETARPERRGTWPRM